MYRVINDFFEDWKYETESTLKVFKNLTQQSLEQKVTPDGRSLRKLAWHITLGNPQMLTHAGFDIGKFDEDAPPPDKLEDIIKYYEKYSMLVNDVIKASWKDENLTEELDLYGEKWKKGKILSVLLIHQTHHRAQMTVLMRQAGLKVPGIYGPAKEEWAEMGREPEE